MGGHLTKFRQKQFCTVMFETRCICVPVTSDWVEYTTMCVLSLSERCLSLFRPQMYSASSLFWQWRRSRHALTAQIVHINRSPNKSIIDESSSIWQWNKLPVIHSLREYWCIKLFLIWLIWMWICFSLLTVFIVRVVICISYFPCAPEWMYINISLAIEL